MIDGEAVEREGQTMKRRYASFLIRWWQHSTGRQRVTVSHIQSGEQVGPESLPAAFAWIVDRTAATSADGDVETASATDSIPLDTDDDGAPPAASS